MTGPTKEQIERAAKDFAREKLRQLGYARFYGLDALANHMHTVVAAYMSVSMQMGGREALEKAALEIERIMDTARSAA